MRFDDQSVLISGATSGLGRAYALALAERGARLWLLDCTDSHSDAVLSLLRSVEAAGGSARYRELDLADAAAIDAALPEFARAGISLLVNNAGRHSHGDFAHLSSADFMQQLQVDVYGSFALTHGLWHGMMERGYGRVVMTTGVSALYGDMHQSAFACAKMALVGLVNGLAAEGAGRNVRVNSLCPLAHTPMTEKHLAIQVKPLFSKEIITAVMLFLLSGNAPFGRHLLAGGGSVSELCLAEHSYRYFDSACRTPEAVAAHWGEIASAWPIQTHSSGEEQILAFAKRTARELGVKLD